MENTRDLVARKPNILIETRHQFSLYEMRLVFALLVDIRHDDPVDTVYHVPLDRFLPEEAGGRYARARQAVVDITKKAFVLRKGRKETFVSMFDHITLDPDSTVVEIQLHRMLQPYFLALKDGGYTEVRLRHVLPLRSTYSIRLYELLRQYRNSAQLTREITIEDLRFFLDIPTDKLERYVDIRRKIIEPAQKHLKESTDISFEVSEVKQGRKVIALRFQIAPQEPVSKGVQQQEIPLTFPVGPDKVQQYYTDLFGETISQTYFKRYGREYLAEYKKIAEEIKPTSLKRYLKQGIENDEAGIKAKLSAKHRAEESSAPIAHDIPAKYLAPEDADFDEILAHSLKTKKKK